MKKKGARQLHALFLPVNIWMKLEIISPSCGFDSPVATMIPGEELLVEMVPDIYGFSDIWSCR